jgi:hypothetical protein
MIGLEQWGLLVCDLVSRHRIVGSGGEELAPIYYRVPGYIPQIFVFILRKKPSHEVERSEITLQGNPRLSLSSRMIESKLTKEKFKVNELK